MKQYCRYCGLACETDVGFYCQEKEAFLSQSALKRVNTCKSYGYCGTDLITGRDHVIVERAPKRRIEKGPELEQIMIGGQQWS